MSPFFHLSAILLAFALVCAASPAPSSGVAEAARKCKEIRVHKEWRDISVKHRLAYIDAVKCLQALPPTVPGTAATSRYEDACDCRSFVASELNLELRDKCHYKGPIPFWDWARDGDNEGVPIAKSPIFDPVTGFGGDGVLGTYTLPSPNISTVTFPQSYRGCVLDGPFSADKYTVHLGPGTLTTKHCLVRGINETLKHAMTTDVLEEQLRIKTFAELRATIDNPRAFGMHITTHSAIGGEMKNVWSSPGEPLFFLSHMNLDRMWWHWQWRDYRKRLYYIDGPSTVNGTDNVTLDFVMDFPRISSNVTIRDVMDLTKEPNCYTFEY
ncbi:Di-copper centre-containing protein [Coprinellus micaceus]|uniref:Di-copper centre-containing protein n=1 Tax=Coprinellus micaceus TaxID=71717 RepID=A0A4Y7SLL4_COPMI|nr:Di-copper centre-containing protein [Coprinellus micaceus]